MPPQHLFSNGLTTPSRPRPPHYRGFTITLRHTTLGRTPLDEGSAGRRHLYLTTQENHKRQTSMAPAGFEPTIPASQRPQSHAFNRAAAGIGSPIFLYHFSMSFLYYITSSLELVLLKNVKFNLSNA
jgi:hypothetical protein